MSASHDFRLAFIRVMYTSETKLEEPLSNDFHTGVQLPPLPPAPLPDRLPFRLQAVSFTNVCRPVALASPTGFGRSYSNFQLPTPNPTAMRIHRHRVRKPKFEVQQYNVNEQIKAPQVRVVDHEGNPLGVLDTSVAIEKARAAGHDLVEVSPKAEPPVCRFIDYGHFKYQKKKEARKAKAQSKEVEVKGIRLSLRIGDHDLEVRKDQAEGFLERGDKLKVEIVLRGREKAHADVAREVVNRFLTMLRAKYTLRVEQPLSSQGGRLTVTVARQ